MNKRKEEKVEKREMVRGIQEVLKHNLLFASLDAISRAFPSPRPGRSSRDLYCVAFASTDRNVVNALLRRGVHLIPLAVAGSKRRRRPARKRTADPQIIEPPKIEADETIITATCRHIAGNTCPECNYHFPEQTTPTICPNCEAVWDP